MSQFQTNEPGYPQPITKLSGAAIASLILGVLGCIPFITGLGAIVCGIVGIKSTSKPGMRGKGLAITGLILGIVNLVGWTGLGAMGVWGYGKTKPDRMMGTSFVQDLSASNIPAAQALCVPGTSADSLQQTATQLQGYGPFKSVTFMSFNYNANIGQPGTGQIGGIAVFGNVTKQVTITVTHPPGGTAQISSWQFQ